MGEGLLPPWTLFKGGGAPPLGPQGGGRIRNFGFKGGGGAPPPMPPYGYRQKALTTRRTNCLRLEILNFCLKTTLSI